MTELLFVYLLLFFGNSYINEWKFDGYYKKGYYKKVHILDLISLLNNVYCYVEITKNIEDILLTRGRSSIINHLETNKFEEACNISYYT